MTLRNSFKQDILNYALDLATENIVIGQEDHVDLRFQICGQLLAAGAKLMSNNQKWLVFHKSITLTHLCCYYGNTAFLKQLISSMTKEHLELILKYEYSIKNADKQYKAGR